MVPSLFGVALVSALVSLGTLVLAAVVSTLAILLIGIEFCVRPPYKRSFTVHGSAL